MQQLSKNQIKQFTSLQTGKGRKKHQIFLAEGDRCVLQILENNILRLRAIILKSEAAIECVPDTFQKLCLTAPDNSFNQITESVNPQNLAAVFEIPPPQPKAFPKLANGKLLYLDRLQDPGNLGTIIRSAAWFGINGILLAKGTADMFQPKVVRSTAGATGSIPYAFDDDGQIIESLGKSGWNWYVTTLSEDSVSVDEVNFAKKSVVVIGNEANGVADHFLNPEFLKIHIPGISNGTVESLNAAVSAGIVMHRLPDN